MNRIDKKIIRLGYAKKLETSKSVYYEKSISHTNFKKCIVIYKKHDDTAHITVVLQKNDEMIQLPSSLTIDEMKLFTEKMKYWKRKYKKHIWMDNHGL